MKAVKLLILFLLCLTLCFGCGKKEGEKQETKKSTSDEAKEKDKSAADNDGDTRADHEIIAEAMEKTSKLASFKADTKASLKLGGKTINGEFGAESQIHVVQSDGAQNLQMTMETRISPGDMVSKSYYKDGCYYLDDGKKKYKQEKAPEEVLGIVTDITKMVIESSDKIEDISVEQSGKEKVYSYGLPSYIAADYAAKLMKEMGAEDTVLEDVSHEIEEIRLSSTVNEGGVLTRQEISAAGELKKAILVVPVEAKITAEFTETDDKELKMELW